MTLRPFFLLGLTVLLACSRPDPLPIYSDAPRFELTTSNGEPFSSDELAGKVWVADFIFTHCRGPCPMMSRQMLRLQQAVEGLDDVRLISVTVDPERDSPEVLGDYAERYQADARRWTFLTGSKQAIYEMIFHGFRLAVDDGELTAEGKPGPGIITHSVKFALVDRAGRIRGYYSGNDRGLVDAILPDIRRLLAENAT